MGCWASISRYSPRLRCPKTKWSSNLSNLFANDLRRGANPSRTLVDGARPAEDLGWFGGPPAGTLIPSPTLRRNRARGRSAGGDRLPGQARSFPLQRNGGVAYFIVHALEGFFPLEDDGEVAPVRFPQEGFCVVPRSPVRRSNPGRNRSTYASRSGHEPKHRAMVSAQPARALGCQPPALSSAWTSFRACDRSSSRTIICDPARDPTRTERDHSDVGRDERSYGSTARR